MIVIVVVVVLLVASVLAVSLLAPPSAPSVQVQSIYIWAPDNVCGLNSNPIDYYGYNSSTGAANAFQLEVPNYNTTTCVIEGVTTNTTGFALSDVEVPVSIPGNSTGNLYYGSLNVTITSPGSSFSGILNLVFA